VQDHAGGIDGEPFTWAYFRPRQLPSFHRTVKTIGEDGAEPRRATSSSRARRPVSLSSSASISTNILNIGRAASGSVAIIFCRQAGPPVLPCSSVPWYHPTIFRNIPPDRKQTIQYNLRFCEAYVLETNMNIRSAQQTAALQTWQLPRCRGLHALPAPYGSHSPSPSAVRKQHQRSYATLPAW
jgi:hypothetical protein